MRIPGRVCPQCGYKRTEPPKGPPCECSIGEEEVTFILSAPHNFRPVPWDGKATTPFLCDADRTILAVVPRDAA